MPMCRKAAAALRGVGYGAEVIDLRSLSPWDEQAVLASAERTGRLMIVHEENLTCGFGAEIAATVAEKARVAVLVRRVTRPDTFVPSTSPTSSRCCRASSARSKKPRPCWARR